MVLERLEKLVEQENIVLVLCAKHREQAEASSLISGIMLDTLEKLVEQEGHELGRCVKIREQAETTAFVSGVVLDPFEKLMEQAALSGHLAVAGPV